MKKPAIVFLISLFLFVMAPFRAIAGHDHNGKEKEIDHSAHAGDRIHESEVDGHRLTYHLIVLPDGAGEKHHMVLYVADPDGKPVEKAKAGFMVEGPDGSKQRVMAMSMPPGFGGDVNLKTKGAYTIKTKFEMSERSLIDSFTYSVE